MLERRLIPSKYPRKPSRNREFYPLKLLFVRKTNRKEIKSSIRFNEVLSININTVNFKCEAEHPKEYCVNFENAENKSERALYTVTVSSHSECIIMASKRWKRPFLTEQELLQELKIGTSDIEYLSDDADDGDEEVVIREKLQDEEEANRKQLK
ncbi:hypothetical protein JTB14_028998 [Gonioctena quinquepunctata]|nr:hypothetical protein JTB14_028998 [Gonioctena quinquepunctata]